MTLRLINYEGEEIFRALVATGANPGNKRKAGDLRTPEGVFQVVDIQNSSEDDILGVAPFSKMAWLRLVKMGNFT